MRFNASFNQSSPSFTPQFGESEQTFRAGYNNLQTINGKDGKSAYELAVDNGYKGTEAEWLESLHGKDGKDGADGQPGRDGIPGKDGKDGEPGVPGKNGVDGVNGKDGYTPIKGVDYFDGKDGQNGKDGYTPVRGTDYWTAADKAEMVSAVIAALPIYNGEVVSV